MNENINYQSDEQNLYQGDEVAHLAFSSFGIKYLFPWQRLVIQNILEPGETQSRGRQIVLLPTGAGKSLCFLIPSIILEGPTLIIYPLLALMSDQERRIKEAGLDCVTFRGGQSSKEQDEYINKIKNGCKIIICNPEVLLNANLVRKLKSCNISHIAIDEAHCVSEWGDSFRPAYLELGKIIKELKAPLVTAFTATASPEVLKRISDILFDGYAHVVKSEMDRPNIHYSVIKTAAKRQQVLLLAKTQELPMIVFFSTRHNAELVSKDLITAYGREFARFYHAGLSREEKNDVESWFFNNKNAVLCATCAYGMGVDKKDIRTVVHFDPPATIESYAQEAGRGGRDGKDSNAILLWNTSDSLLFRSFSNSSRKRAMLHFAEDGTCRRQILLDYLDGEKAVCSGCDICNKTEPIMESDYNIALRMIKRANKYYTEDTFCLKYIELANKIYKPYVGINCWDLKGALAVLEELFCSKKIKTTSFPWEDRIALL